MGRRPDNGSMTIRKKTLLSAEFPSSYINTLREEEKKIFCTGFSLGNDRGVHKVKKQNNIKPNKSGIRPSTKNINNMLPTKFLIHVTLLASITVIWRQEMPIFQRQILFAG